MVLSLRLSKPEKARILSFRVISMSFHKTNDGPFYAPI